jgi:hypothetical protein
MSYDRLLTFESVHQAVRAEKLLCQAGIAVSAVPTPREIELSCGQSLLIYSEDERQVLAVIVEGRVQWRKLFRRDERNRIYEKIRELEG